MPNLPLSLCAVIAVAIQAHLPTYALKAYGVESSPPPAESTRTRVTWEQGRQVCRRWNGYLPRPEVLSKWKIRGWSDLTRKHGYIQSESAADSDVLAALSRNEEWVPYILSEYTRGRNLCFVPEYIDGVPGPLAQRPCDLLSKATCSLPYKNGILSVPSCPKRGWLDMDTKSKCIWPDYTKVPQDEAQKMCVQHGGQLAIFKGTSSYDTLASVLLRQHVAAGMDTFWIHAKSGIDEAEGLANWDSTPSFSATGKTLRVGVVTDGTLRMNRSTAQPQMQYPFICEVPLIAGTPWLRVGMERVGDTVTFTCYSSPEIIEGSIMWFKDGLAVRGNRVLLDPNSNTLTLPSATRYSPYLQGYYWCEGTSLDGFKEIESQKWLLRLPGIETLIGSIQLNTNAEFRSERPGLYDLSSISFIDFARALRRKITSEAFIDMQKIGAYYLSDVKLFGLHKWRSDVLVARFAMYYRRDRDSNEVWSEKDIMALMKKTLILHDVAGHRVLPESTEMLSTRACLSDTTSFTSAPYANLSWPETVVGGVAIPAEPCAAYDTGQVVVRKCEGNYTVGAYWGEVQGSCTALPSKRTLELRALSQALHKSSDPLSTAEGLRNLTSERDKLQPQDIVYAVEALVDIASLPKISKQLAETVLMAIDSIIHANSTALYRSRVADTTNKLLGVMEHMAANLEDSMVVFSGLTAIGKMPHRQATPGIYLNAAEQSWTHFSTAEDLTKHAEVGILFPAFQCNDSITDIENANLTLGLVPQNALFGSASDIWYRNCTDVLLLKYIHRQIENATFSFYFRDKCHNKTRAMKLIAECVFWDTQADGGLGAWSREGCTYIGMVGEHHRCNCTHLTSFGIMFKENDLLEEDIHDIILSYLTLIGIALSMFGLLMVILTYAVSKEVKKGVGHKCLLNLSISLLGSLFMFALMVTTHDALEDSTTCIVMGVILHYLLLVAFSWTLVETLLQYLRYVKVLGTYVPHLMLKCGLPAWGVPVAVVAAAVSYDPKNYNSRRQLCWPQGQPLLYSFFLPLGLILTANLVVFSMVIYSIYCKRHQALRSNQAQREQAKLQLRATVCVVFLLGLTWIFAYLSIIDAYSIRRVFEYLFVVSSTLQGFAIFLFHVAYDKTTRKLWRDKLNRWRGHVTGAEGRHRHLNGADMSQSDPGLVNLETQLRHRF